MGGNAFAFLDEAIGGDADGPAAQHRRARAERANASVHHVGVAIAIGDQVGVDPEAVG
jgi:hypothetical protein